MSKHYTLLAAPRAEADFGQTGCVSVIDHSN
jgi:hypothetical protein